MTLSRWASSSFNVCREERVSWKYQQITNICVWFMFIRIKVRERVSRAVVFVSPLTMFNQWWWGQTETTLFVCTAAILSTVLIRRRNLCRDGEWTNINKTIPVLGRNWCENERVINFFVSLRHCRLNSNKDNYRLELIFEIMKTGCTLALWRVFNYHF